MSTKLYSFLIFKRKILIVSHRRFLSIKFCSVYSVVIINPGRVYTDCWTMEGQSNLIDHRMSSHSCPIIHTGHAAMSVVALFMLVAVQIDIRGWFIIYLLPLTEASTRVDKSKHFFFLRWWPKLRPTHLVIQVTHLPPSPLHRHWGLVNREIASSLFWNRQEQQQR
jgi:hypothetical protein